MPWEIRGDVQRVDVCCTLHPISQCKRRIEQPQRMIDITPGPPMFSRTTAGRIVTGERANAAALPLVPLALGLTRKSVYMASTIAAGLTVKGTGVRDDVFLRY